MAIRKLPNTAIESLNQFTAAVDRLMTKTYLRKEQRTQDKNKVERGLKDLAGNIGVARKTRGSRERARNAIEAAREAARKIRNHKKS